MSEDSGAADENTDDARKLNKKSRENDTIFFLKDDFFHLNRVLKISSYFFLMIIMCTHNGNFPQTAMNRTFILFSQYRGY